MLLIEINHIMSKVVIITDIVQDGGFGGDVIITDIAIIIEDIDVYLQDGELKMFRVQ